MEFEVDLRVFELLSSRLCHDIVGPVGAVNNGLEMLEDDEFGMADDAVALAAMSARQAAAALQFYRMAYGMAGTRTGMDLSSLHDLASGKMEKQKVEVVWERPLAPEGAPDGFGKLALNLIDLAAEALPRGGSITVELVREGGAVEARLVARGQGCSLRPETSEGLDENTAIADLSPRSVHGYYTRILAKRLEGGLEVGNGDGESMTFTARVPAA